jgi:ribonuclease HI
MFTSKLGYNSNNGAELEGLIRGLDMAKNQGIKSMIVEGDSLLIISTLKCLMDGSNPEKITTNWRLSHGWAQTTNLIQNFQVIIPYQV